MSLITCVKRTVQGVSDSEMYRAISKNVQTVATAENATLEDSQLRTWCQTTTRDEVWYNVYLHELQLGNLTGLVPLIIVLHCVTHSPGKDARHGHGEDKLQGPEREEQPQSPSRPLKLDH